LCVGINENNDAVTRSGQAMLEGARLAAIFLLQHANTRIAVRNAVNLFSSLVARTVIHHDNFNFAFVVRGEQRAQSFRNHFAFVVGSNYDADWLCEICSRRALKTISEPDNDQRANDH
jgi:hypothetical protein